MSENYRRYLTTYSGKQLIPQLKKVGTWHVKGEDPNCDFGGPHYQPSLGYYEGKLEDVIRMAVELPKFWQWGGGGSIELISVSKVGSDTFKRKAELRIEAEKLTARLKEITAEIKE